MISKILTAAAVLGIAVTAWAGDMSKRLMPGSTPATSAHHQMVGYGVLRTEQLIGLPFSDSSPRLVGEVKDIVFDKGSQRLAYVIVSPERSVGLGGRYLAVPWSVVSIENMPASDKVHFVIKFSHDQLKDAPSVARDRWSDLDTVQFNQQVDRFYQTNMEMMLPVTVEPARHSVVSEPAGSTPTIDLDIYTGEYATRSLPREGEIAMLDKAFDSRRLSHVIGMSIDRDDSRIGRIEDVVADGRNGSLLYAIVSFNKSVKDISGKWAALPWTVLNATPEMEAFALHADNDTLRAVAYDRDSLPALSDRVFARSINDRFNVSGGVYGFVGSGSVRPEAVSTSAIGGAVEAVDTTTEAGVKDILRLKVKTDDGKYLWVLTGPKSYVDTQGISFKEGYRISAIGSRSVMDGRAVFMAHDMTVGKLWLHLRDAQGSPLWTTHSKESMH